MLLKYFGTFFLDFLRLEVFNLYL